MIKGILFDFDGTLSYRVESAYRMYRDMLGKMFPEMDENGIEFEGRVQRCMLWDEYGTINKRHVLEMIKKKWKPDLDVEEYAEYWYKHFYEYQVLMPDAEEVLTKLKEKYVLGILSNGDSYTQWIKIDKLELRDYFKTVIVSGDLGIHKPDPAIYEKAASKMDLKCEEIAFIGDTFDTDILGAVRAGMKPVLMSYEHRVESKYPVTQVQTFRQIEEMFLKQPE